MIGGEHADIAAAVATLTYSVVLNELLPDAVHVPANLATAAAVLTLARRSGASPAELGLSTDTLMTGARVGLAVAAPIVAGIALAARLPAAAPYFEDARVLATGRGRAVYETAIRIPIGTALGEELLFRGALLGLFARRYSTAGAIAVSSALFGLWHVLPTLHSGVDPFAGTDDASPTMLLVLGNVAATMAAGVGFAVLRLRSRSVIAPAIVHATINTSAFLAARRSPRRRADFRPAS